MGEPLIHVIYGDKWLPALPLLHAYAVAIAIGFLTPLAAPLLDATGRPKVVLKLSIFSTLASWALVASCTPRFGTTGFVWSYAAHVIAGNLILVFILRRMLPKVRLLRHTWAPALAGVGACTAAHFAAPYAHTIPSFVAATLGILALHCGAMYLLDPAGTRDAFNLIPTVSRGKPRPVGPVNQEAA
jgi:O-antigen/teichoic acid export membrane protein